MAHQLDRHSHALTHRVLAYQRTGTRATALLRDLSLYAYEYPRRKYPSLDEDVSGEFYLFLAPKLPRLLARFRDCGKPFEHYLNSVLSWQLKSFLLRRRRGEIAWQLGVSSPRWCDGASGFSECAEVADRHDLANRDDFATGDEPVVAAPAPSA